MSVAATQGANAPVVEKKEWTWFQVTSFISIVILVTAFSLGYVAQKSHRPTPIKNAIARLVNWLPFLAPFVLLDDGPAVSEGPCECECKEDGTAEAIVDGVKVEALNHEFGS
jgi:hypothetical protein